MKQLNINKSAGSSEDPSNIRGSEVNTLAPRVNRYMSSLTTALRNIGKGQASGARRPTEDSPRGFTFKLFSKKEEIQDSKKDVRSPNKPPRSVSSSPVRVSLTD